MNFKLDHYLHICQLNDFENLNLKRILWIYSRCKLLNCYVVHVLFTEWMISENAIKKIKKSSKQIQEEYIYIIVDR